jgi:uridine kinase
LTIETLSSLLGRLVEAGFVSDQDTSRLIELAQADPVELALVTNGAYSLEASIARRLQTFAAVAASVRERGFKFEVTALWSHHLPLADLMLTWCRSKRPCLFGIAGSPGVGKTSLTAVLAIAAGILSETPVAVVSLDDFYLGPSERQRLGHKWRAMPGTHDLKLLSNFLEEVSSEQTEIRIPRYDTRTEKRLPPIPSARPQIIFFEGFFVGAAVPGYEMLTKSLSYLIYLHMDLELAHQCRLDREARIRVESNNTRGMSERETECFWQEALLPTITEWVTPLERCADLTLSIDGSHRICGVSSRKLEQS